VNTATGALVGTPWPLGATSTNTGTNFAVFSRNAQRIEICFFDAAGDAQHYSVFLPAKTNDIWHGFIPNIADGALYGIRAYGPFMPERGHWFDATKVLLDPYAKSVFQTNNGHFIAQVSSQKTEPTVAPLQPKIAAANRVIYELHVKGFSKLNGALPEELRGTFAGLAHPNCIAHFKNLGITSLCLLPVHFAFDEPRLTNLGLSNYWGYNTLAFFAPTSKYASTANPGAEFRSMVKALHDANIEVLLDVVYNHTAESDEHGPTLSLRGLDNASYYRLPQSAPQTFVNFAGCGNTLDIRQAPVRQLVMDSLRYWVKDMGVDGFRFDLAPILGRQNSAPQINDNRKDAFNDLSDHFGDHFSDDFNAGASFFQIIAQDPVLSQVTMIAEPWDIGPNGYQLGNFPRPWAEWNDQFRDTIRRFWLHDGQPSVSRAAMATRLCGSADIFQKNDRAPNASINYVVSHDGFTLHDAVSYGQRHNEANGENNRDGHGHNFSVNCGVEGATDDHYILAFRARLKRALIASTMLSLGTPMFCAGDELGHSQQGNNNPYCQDNETTWIDWTKRDDTLVAFTSNVIDLRKRCLPLGKHWGEVALVWLTADGKSMTEQDWHRSDEHCFACLINSSMLLLLNPLNEQQTFALPTGHWSTILDSTLANGRPEAATQFQHLMTASRNSLIVLEKSADPQ
jgi:pullulanase/glycogen debranching enzyme